MMSDARCIYFADRINENSDNPRTPWKTINNIIHRVQSPSIPAFSDIKFSELFSKKFIDKIEKIRMIFTNNVHNMQDIQSSTVNSLMPCFEQATADEVRKIIIKFTWQNVRFCCRIRYRPIVVYFLHYPPPLSYVIQRHNVKHHLYSNNNLIYI